MRQAGLRDPEAFILYQKGMDYFERAHGEMDQIEGLRLANGYYEQVMDVVPEYWEVYANHSDLYVHMLNDVLTDQFEENITEETLADAYRSMLADYEAASQHAPTDRLRYLAELDYAFLSGNWRGMAGRLEKALGESGCRDSNWTATVANVLGYSAEYFELADKVLACDPLRSLSWFNAARAKFWAGDAQGALEIAREGSEVAPGNWLTMTQLQTLIANDLHDEAHGVIVDRIQHEGFANVFHIMVAAHRGDTDRLASYLEAADFENRSGGFFMVPVSAWIGRRDIANATAAEIDEHYFGANVLWQLVQWCQCGAPWDLEVTPNFAARIEEANLTWPPVTPLTYPLKDW
jgi:tetratricopeptide (TPR) repeat protein